MEDALRYVAFREEKKFYDLVISIKSSDVQTTYAANRLFSAQCDYPLHIGVTEAGTYEDGIIVCGGNRCAVARRCETLCAFR